MSRSPKRVDPSDDLCPADLLDGTAVDNAVAGSEVAYLVAGLKCDTATWQDQWPHIMRNVIPSRARHKSKLVFVDNVYAYDKSRRGDDRGRAVQPDQQEG